MRIIIGNLFILLFFLSLSCDKEEKSPFGLSCDNLKSGIINSDTDMIGAEISKVIQGLNPQPTAEDIVGHAANFDILLQRLSPCDFKTIQLVCYYCGFTNPSHSEVVLTAYSGSKAFTLVLDIITPQDGALSYKGIHVN